MSDPLALDKTLWQPRDAKWLKAREKLWQAKQRLLCVYKTPKAMTIVKRFFLRGTLPDWHKVNAKWDEEDQQIRHLDPFTLLWLHPANSEAELSELLRAYLQPGFGRVWDDVAAGFCMFSTLCAYVPSDNGIIPVQVGKSYRSRNVEMKFDADVEMLTRLFCAIGEQAKFVFGDQEYRVPAPALGMFAQVSRWLKWDKVTEYGGKMALQHDAALALMRNVINAHPEVTDDAFKRMNSFPWACYRFHHFDTKREGATVRSHFVKNMRRSLDSDAWPVQIKDMWQQTKSGELKVEKPW